MGGLRPQAGRVRRAGAGDERNLVRVRSRLIEMRVKQQSCCGGCSDGGGRGLAAKPPASRSWERGWRRFGGRGPGTCSPIVTNCWCNSDSVPVWLGPATRHCAVRLCKSGMQALSLNQETNELWRSVSTQSRSWAHAKEPSLLIWRAVRSRLVHYIDMRPQCCTTVRVPPCCRRSRPARRATCSTGRHPQASPVGGLSAGRASGVQPAVDCGFCACAHTIGCDATWESLPGVP